ncbi:hypothetical protein YYC_03288 [Plasmodium yoelii 17X]|uniref:Uncharacterized protein n=1 Tax=Plasmodium yoelii 17X TaxID=1323249 RepID=V7PNM9_PLAYE|nr:hypothetical protein YYC_03288 [Plasmodium yoelii 17X]
MWLSDNLYKIQNNGKFTLKEPYEKHLDKYIGYFNYWKIVNNGLKDANHRNMRKFYTDSAIKKETGNNNLD